MAATIKQISEISGVSRGTVDRVLNGRGKVSPEKEQLVRSVAKQLGYKPNLAGKALAARKKLLSIGLLLIAEGIPFFDDLLKGAHQAEAELNDYGLQLCITTLHGYDVAAQLAAMEALAHQVNALILNPINDPAIAQKINEFADNGIPVFTVNTDIEDSKRLCYIGNDYVRSGATAAGMLGLLLPSGGKLGILTGSVKILGHSQRIAGFRAVLRESYPQLTVADVAETNDDDIVAFEVTRKMLLIHPELSGLFVVAAGTYGVCRAVLSLGMEKKLVIVSVDNIPSTEEMLRAGVIKATICQQPFTQGYQAVKHAWQCLISGQPPESDSYITKSEIKIAQNLS